jgi:hypothetical protein
MVGGLEEAGMERCCGSSSSMNISDQRKGNTNVQLLVTRPHFLERFLSFLSA